eukprot:CAMPEP_0197892178 /NCGR_PEP_ID=MMETSP1439-20131203/30011_1 /TAXON_ID=66791 /ORGANISM="Gonyaulax spinifera, Strain CCMP409" /LENGTH=44 /DNA_ID= /DNA_START= /DNA_END= /DNA_ORIENTATION=
MLSAIQSLRPMLAPRGLAAAARATGCRAFSAQMSSPQKFGIYRY